MSRCRFVEWLERRLFLSAAPTANDLLNDEEQTLQLINRMHQNPAAELPLLENSTDPGVQEGIKFFGVNLATLASQWASLVAVPPLAMNTILDGTALAHDQLMLADNSQSHLLPGESDLGTRILAAGYQYETAGESIFIAGTSVFDTQAAFAIDWGSGMNTMDGIQDPPGHRENIMDSSFTEMGIAFLGGPDTLGDGVTPGPLVVTEDFGSQQTPDGPFLLGAVFNDTNRDGFYTAGEGMSGVTVTAVGGGRTTTTTTSETGAYQIALPAGTYAVTFSGGPLTSPRTINNVVIGLNNVELNDDLSTASITSAKSATFSVGTPKTFTITTTGSPAISDNNFTLPSGLAFTDSGNGTATIAGTPAAGTGGSYVLTLTASNGLGTPPTQVFTLTIDQAPTISIGGPTTFTVGLPQTLKLAIGGFPAVRLTETGALPAGLAVRFNNGQYAISGTPAAGTGKTYAISFTAANGITPNATQVFTLTVDQPPAIAAVGAPIFSTIKAVTFPVKVTGFPFPSLTPTGLPTGVSVTTLPNGTTAITGTAASNESGPFTVTLGATNTTGSAAQVFTLTVDHPPAISSTNAMTFVTSVAGTFHITTSGFPAPTVSAIGALPAGLTVKNSLGQAVISGTPGALTGKTYGITLVATNGIGTSFPQPFTLIVDQPPAISVPASAIFSTLKATTLTTKTTGFPIPIVTASGLPVGLTYNPNGTITGTAASNDAPGSYTVTLTANNNVGPQQMKTFTLLVDEPPVILQVFPPILMVGQPVTVTLQTTGFPAATLTESGALPTGVRFYPGAGGTAMIAGTPAMSSEGKTFTVTISAANGIGTRVTQSYSLIVDFPEVIAG